MFEPPKTPAVNTDETQAIASQIMSLLTSLRFGSIEIVVHDGRIVQIDKHEKFRLKDKQVTN